jgi:ferredoxin-NADP reductase
MSAYSVVSGDTNRFEFGVALDANSRGGSEFLHETTKEGDIFSVGEITTSFPLLAEADHQILIAGGIGIQAFIPAAMAMQAAGQPYTLHLAGASFRRYPFQVIS